jgi:hypothetical protein
VAEGIRRRKTLSLGESKSKPSQGRSDVRARLLILVPAAPSEPLLTLSMLWVGVWFQCCFLIPRKCYLANPSIVIISSGYSNPYTPHPHSYTPSLSLSLYGVSLEQIHAVHHFTFPLCMFWPGQDATYGWSGPSPVSVRPFFCFSTCAAHAIGNNNNNTCNNNNDDNNNNKHHSLTLHVSTPHNSIPLLLPVGLRLHLRHKDLCTWHSLQPRLTLTHACKLNT